MALVRMLALDRWPIWYPVGSFCLGPWMHVRYRISLFCVKRSIYCADASDEKRCKLFAMLQASHRVHCKCDSLASSAWVDEAESAMRAWLMKRCSCQHLQPHDADVLLDALRRLQTLASSYSFRAALASAIDACQLSLQRYAKSALASAAPWDAHGELSKACEFACQVGFSTRHPVILLGQLERKIVNAMQKFAVSHEALRRTASSAKEELASLRLSAEREGEARNLHAFLHHKRVWSAIEAAFRLADILDATVLLNAASAENEIMELVETQRLWHEELPAFCSDALKSYKHALKEAQGRLKRMHSARLKLAQVAAWDFDGELSKAAAFAEHAGFRKGDDVVTLVSGGAEGSAIGW
mmetsp:Transcript_17209/g.46940  ORF Transcript_17209/g.46940 Transcript_17209/m.46940 type:complete len:356 (-) Transcript_17209:49-1116(-)